MLRTAALTALAGVLVSASSTLAAASFFDGVFNNSDWTLSTITNAAGAGSITQGFQVPTGGNPSQYRIVRNNLQISAVNSLVVGVHINVTASYTPSSQGAITFINYSEDSKNFSSQGGNGQGTGLAIIQGGNTYIQRNPILSMPFSGFSNWAPNAAPGLVASDLWQIDNAGNFFPGNNPDFSATGTVMQLGFYRGNSSGTLSSGTFNTECGIDNWSVQIVPAPGAAALLGTGGFMAMRRRRR